MSRRALLTLASIGLATSLSVATATFAVAAGGSGGGGGTTAGATGGGGGGATGGGGGNKAACTNAVSVSATATESLVGNNFSATYALTSCQSKTHVALTVTDVSNGALVWSVPDLIGTTAVWTQPYKLTSYRVGVRAYTSTQTVATATTTVDTLTVIPCTPFVAESATVGYYINYAAIWAATNVESCGSPNALVRVRIKNLTSGVTEFDTLTTSVSSMFDYEGPQVSYSTPYEVDADLQDSSGAVIATSTSLVTSSPLR
jgi:hypothetical protein